ncbi:MAG: hypothetical protein IIY58_04135 [Aeriscardovia sp.]|nr:hypothetical protein [Aeriscardovia sp.]
MIQNPLCPCLYCVLSRISSTDSAEACLSADLPEKIIVVAGNRVLETESRAQIPEMARKILQSKPDFEKEWELAPRLDGQMHKPIYVNRNPAPGGISMIELVLPAKIKVPIPPLKHRRSVELPAPKR